MILNAVESRLRTTVLIGGGIENLGLLPEADHVNFASRIRGPTLMLSGRYDEELAYEPSARILFELLPEPKRFDRVESGHLPPAEIRSPIINAWLDETLSPVRR